jgi:CRP-like cAMP-binding protein
LEKKEFYTLLNSSHQFAINLVKILSKLLLQDGVSRRVESFGAVNNLVANTLCSLAQIYGEERDAGVLVRKEISQSELAKMVGTSRKSIIHALTHLTENSLIEKEDKYFFIPNLIALQSFASYF